MHRFLNDIRLYTHVPVMLLVGLFLLTGFQTHRTPDPDQLIGKWLVDLRPTPDAEPYYQALVITSIEGDRIKGSFYSTAIQHGRINTAWGKTVIAFVTEDGSGPYATTAELVDGQLVGSTHSIGREFLIPWTAVKE